jgi:hypothetical protein
MSVSRDMQRLMQLDAKILDLEYLYTRELMREQELGKTTLLMSRVFKNRIVLIQRARTKLAQAMQNNPNRRKTYQMELTIRKDELDEAREELDKLEKQIGALGLQGGLSGSEYEASEMRRLSREIPVQKRRIASKLRAYENWAKKDSMVPVRQTRSRIPKGYDAEEDAKAIHGDMPYDPEILKGINKTLTPKDILGKNPNWDKPENNATLDLLSSQPIYNSDEKKELYTGTGQLIEEELAEENPFLLQEKHKQIIIGE